MPMNNPVPNTPNNLWYQKQHHVRIPAAAESKAFLDAYYTGQGAGSPAGLFAAGEQGAWLDIEPFSLDWRRNLWDDSSVTFGLTASNAFSSVTDDVTFAGWKCSQLDFKPYGSLTLVTKAYGPTLVLGARYRHTIKLALSRQLVNGEQVRVQCRQPGGGTFLRYTLTSANSDAVAGVWGVIDGPTPLIAPEADTAGLVIFPIVGTLESPLTVYVRDAQLEAGLTSTEYQQIIGDGSSQIDAYNPDATLYQDEAGTVRVTAVGQPVGYIRDKSGRGKHATQSNATKQPVYAIAPRARVRNLCTYTEDVQNAAWLKPSATVVNNADGTAWSVAPNTLVTDDVSQALPPAYDATVTLSLKAKANGTSSLSLTLSDSGAVNKLVAAFDVAAGTKTANGVLTGAGWSGNATTISGPDVNGYCTVTMSVAISTFYPTLQAILPVVAVPDGVKGLLIKDVQYECGASATAYQKVVSVYEVTEEGQPSANCLWFDGVDDFMITPVVPFSPATSMFMALGVAPRNDTQTNYALSMSPNASGNSGIAYVMTPRADLVTDAYVSRGTVAATRATPSKAADVPSVLVGVSDIATPQSLLRADGVPGVLGTGTQGTGTFGDYALYLGSDGGFRYYLPGRLFGVIVSNKAATDDDVLNVEAWLTARMAL